ncbi:Uncharacterised protein [Actinomyces slackii]|uniref:LytR/CpsA/Psr regulator C-terminal domain-containing protein n=2 Tax=Actinomyces slackii TaxID=52774 RepID=A0A448KAA7_9ACTO|nr:Uncharacterised protein [Actinomyces slackii]
MVGLVTLSMLVWTGVIPIKGPGFSSSEVTQAYTPPPCPPEGATTVALTDLTINVYNGSETVGLAGTVEEALTDAGLSVANAADWPQGTYEGGVQIMSSPAGLTNAYSLAQVFKDAVVQLDPTLDAEDTSVSVVLGNKYGHTVLSAEEIEPITGGGQAISAPANCVVPSPAATKKS